MDPLTHGLVGATASQFISDSAHIRKASIIGFFSAVLADADVFLGSSADPLLTLELHRQFTHSILFIPVGALIAALIVRWFFRKDFTDRQIYFYSLLGYSTAGLMDVITSYGVLLLWPFSDERIALNIISVFDPVFTLGILFGVIMVIIKKYKKYQWISLSWLIVYLSFAAIQQYRINQKFTDYISHKNVEIGYAVSKPTLANQILWSVKYSSNDKLCGLGVRAGIFSAAEIYEGECAVILNWKEEYSEIQGTVLYDDILRFSEISDGKLIRHPNYPQVIGDGRYSMLPTQISPLWGITVDTTRTDQHVSFDSYRDTSEDIRKAFLKMVFSTD